VIRDDDALAESIELRPTCPSEHLKHILGGKLDPTTFFRVVNLCAFDNNGVWLGESTYPHSSSTNPRSSLDIPAWWMANPNGSKSRKLESLTLPASSVRISLVAPSGFTNCVIVSFSTAISLKNLAVFAVSFRECTNTRV
jgi:hypothetical protein